MNALVICIGNLSRGDDGVAHRVADLLRADPPAGARVLAMHQLDVALAADVAAADAVIFVDAEKRTGPAVAIAVLAPGPGGRSVHSIDPPGLLGLAEALYGHAPAGWLVTVAAPEMGHGEVLSATAEAASVEAASMVRDTLRRNT